LLPRLLDLIFDFGVCEAGAVDPFGSDIRAIEFTDDAKRH
jgi:hypothetical protein